MKVELALMHDYPQMIGLVLIDGELFKVFFHAPKHAGNEWDATLISGAFVELTEESVLFNAIRKGVERRKRPSQELTMSQKEMEECLMGLLEEDREAVRKLLNLKGGDDL